MDTFIVWAALIWGLPSAPEYPIKIGTFDKEEHCWAYAKRNVAAAPRQQIACVRSVISEKSRSEERARSAEMTKKIEDGLRRIRQERSEGKSRPPLPHQGPIDIEID